MKHRKQWNRSRCVIALLWTILLVFTAVPNVQAFNNEPCEDGNHYYSYSIDVTPTCTTEGHSTGYCQYCGIPMEHVMPAIGHDWSGWQTLTEAACTTEGVEIRYCYNCREEQRRLTEPLGHAWGEWYLMQEANCYRPGQEGRICSRCDAFEDRYTEQTQHNWSVIAETPATCTSSGSRTLKCSNCYTEQTETIAALGHSWGSLVTIQSATCIQRSKQRHTCTRCGATEDFDGEYADHVWGQWTIVKQPTAFEAGLEERKCQVCGKKQQREIMPEGTLTQGSTGTAVQELQQALNNAGFSCGTPDGAYGPMTAAAVSQYEESIGIPADGIAWPGVLDALLNAEEEEEFLTIVKEVVTDPPLNGSYYVDGEYIGYKITVFNNTSLTYTDLEMTDILAPESVIAAQEILNPGESFSTIYEYRVSTADAAKGIVTNLAAVTGIRSDGIKELEISNEVTRPTGFKSEHEDGTGEVFLSANVEKKETSAPANGSYYTVGEVIRYTITATNIGNVDFGECIAYDFLDYVGDSIGYVEHLYVGESRDFFFEYTVTPWDVEIGYVMNGAYLELEYQGAYIQIPSNFVYSDTDGESDPATLFEGPGKINTPVRLEGEEDGAVSCTRELTSRTEDSAEYQVGYCKLHEKTRNQVIEMVELAADDAARQKEWEDAAKLWMEDVEAMYAAVLKASDAPARPVVMKERTQFYVMMNSQEAVLKKRYPDQPILVAQKMAELLMNKSVDMCYEIHTAPEDRIDLYSCIDIHTAEEQLLENCRFQLLDPVENNVHYQADLCRSHSLIQSMRETLFQKEGAVASEVYQKLRMIWSAETIKMTSLMLLEQDEEGQKLINLQYAAYDHWLEAREALLTLLYPEKDALIQELMSQTAADHVMNLCLEL